MSETISLKNAASLAGVSIREMRDEAAQSNLYPRAQACDVGNMKIDRELFWNWLEGREADLAKAQKEDEEAKYSEWLAENGEFLERFLTDRNAS